MTLTSDPRGGQTTAHPANQRRLWGPEDRWAGGRGVTCQITRLPEPHDCSFAPQPSGTNAYSSAQASGWRASEEGDGRHCGCQTASPARFPKPAAGFRRRALFRNALVAKHARLGASLAASDRRSESASRLHRISPVQPWGENDNLSDRAYGISCLTRTNSFTHPPGEGGGTGRDRAGVLAFLQSPIDRSIENLRPRRTSCPTAAATGFHRLPLTKTTG
jgi:hypothetical protein